MKAITLTQPYATLAAIDAKKIETRSWSTSHRGKLAIHAGKGLGPVGGKSGLRVLYASAFFRNALQMSGYLSADELPIGAIVATCELVDVCRIYPGSRLFYGRNSIWHLTDQERAFGDYTPGRFAWLLANVEMLSTPIPAKGALGLWEWRAA